MPSACMLEVAIFPVSNTHGWNIACEITSKHNGLLCYSVLALYALHFHPLNVYHTQSAQPAIVMHAYLACAEKRVCHGAGA